MTGRGVVAGVALASGLGGCVIDASIEGKACPCADGWVCDTLRDVCVRRTCDPTVVLSAFAPSWATAHDIRWTWEPNGTPQRFLRYELWVADSEADLRSRSGSARVFGPQENPELASYIVPVAGDLVIATITRGLASGRAHYAQLVAVDVDQCAFASDVAARPTLAEPQNAITLFADALLPGAETAPAPPALEVASEGGAHLEYVALEDEDCVPAQANLDDVKATCGQPLRVRGFSANVSAEPSNPTLPRLTNGEFVDAYLEMRVQIEAPVPSYWSTAWLATGSCSPAEDPSTIFRFDGFTLPNGPEGATIEVPLSLLQSADAPLSYAALDAQAGGAPICGFAVVGTWHKTGIVRIDDVQLRF